MGGRGLRRAEGQRPEDLSAAASAKAEPARVCAHKMVREGSLPEGLRPVTHSSLVRESPLRLTQVTDRAQSGIAQRRRIEPDGARADTPHIARF
jgi:hypothetical protein